MAPLATNLTGRVWFDYVTGSSGTAKEHTIQWRYNSDDHSHTEVQTFFLGFLNSIASGGFMSGWRVLRVRNSLKGQDFSLPVGMIAGLDSFVGTRTTSGYVARWECLEESYQLRSLTSGRRNDFSLYRAIADAAVTFRVPLPDVQRTAIGAAVSGGCLVSVDGTSPVAYDYINSNYNSYWERRVRLG